jgi:hypothetical protein
MSDVDDADVVLLAPVEDREDVTPAQGEEMVDPERPERVGYGEAAMSLLYRSLLCHGGSLTLRGEPP